MVNHQTVNVKSDIIDPSGLGLFGLAMVTFVASTQKLGLTNGIAGVLPWAIFLGAFAQLVAAAYDAKLNKVFGATAFFAYGFFWLGVGLTWLISTGVLGQTLMDMYDPNQLGAAFVGYLIFTIIMTIGASETNKVLFIDFILIDILFISLALTTFGIAQHTTHLIAAYSEMAIALISFYGVAANVLNKHFGYDFVPVGKPLGIFKKS